MDPTKSAYEVLNGPYDWKQYPLAPLGCKAVIEAFYLGPAKDHYRCDNCYVSETRANQISGSTELFLQHCQLPSLTQHQHFCALTEELTENTDIAGVTPKGQRLFKLLGTLIKTILDPPPVSDKQRVILDHQKAAREEEQRVINESPITTLPHLTNAPPIRLTRNPTAKRDLRKTPRLH